MRTIKLPARRVVRSPEANAVICALPPDARSGLFLVFQQMADPAFDLAYKADISHKSDHFFNIGVDVSERFVAFIGYWATRDERGLVARVNGVNLRFAPTAASSAWAARGLEPGSAVGATDDALHLHPKGAARWSALFFTWSILRQPRSALKAARGAGPSGERGVP